MGPLHDAFQFYRFFSGEFTHANPTHLIFNMCGLLMFGIEVESTYGTAFFLALNFMIAMLSSIMTIGFYLVMAYCVPIAYRGGP